MGIVKSHRDLNVYKQAFEASITIHEKTKSFPQEEKYGLTDQIRRCSKSICANIAEGFVKQRRSKAEFKRYLLIALGSCTETQVWIEYCHRLKYIDENEFKTWEDDYEDIRRMLNALYSKA